MTDMIDVAVIGAGVVGLAIARAFAEAGHEVVVIESEDAIGSGVSSRNSEVIHAGLYYAPASLKAMLCVSGRRMLYRYCEERHVAHSRIGKLLVANGPEARTRLDDIRRNACASGVEDLELFARAQIDRLEPALVADAGLYSPSSGIVDSHGLMLALLADAERGGAVLALKSRVDSSRRTSEGIVLTIDADGSSEVCCRRVINAAGLGAIGIAERMAEFPAGLIPKPRLAKGSYFALSGPSPFRHLIYPLPEVGGLGIHLTLDLAEQAKFGPDVEWIESPDYTVDESRRPAFERAVRSYWPLLPEGALLPAYAGIRPKIASADGAAADFCILGPKAHGIAGLVHLFGIESPGLTASLAIARHVFELLD